MSCASDGDVKGCWMVVSGKAVLLSAPVAAAALITHLATGEQHRRFTMLFCYFMGN